MRGKSWLVLEGVGEVGVRVMGSALGARDATETLLGSANPGESLAPLTVSTAQEQAKGRDRGLRVTDSSA